MNRDFVEMLAALSEASADYLVVGAHALAVHGIPRATGDLDLWLRPTPENAARVWAALERADFIRNKKAVGRPRDLADVAELEDARHRSDQG
jgi:hypothetical protein